MKSLTSLGLVVAGLVLAGCGEKPQVAGAAGARKADAHAFQGPAADARYAATEGWKTGDQTAWETQMRVRAQGQNEYSRAAANP